MKIMVDMEQVELLVDLVSLTSILVLILVT